MKHLTVKKINAAKPGKYADGNGLILVVSPKGSKSWLYRYSLNKRRRDMGLGKYPVVSLSDARALVAAYAKKIAQGIDPIQHRNAKKQITPTFIACAARYIKAHRRGWKNKKHQRQWVSTIKTYVKPVMGHTPIDKITLEQVLTVLRPIWQTKTETAKRVQGRIENIIDYATAHHYRTGDNPARWRGYLDKLLAQPSKIKKVKHLPAMPYEHLPGFLQQVSVYSSTSAYALQFLILTATRTSEVLHAVWDEINLAQALWIIPAQRMKAGKEHRIPLSSQALDILDALPRQLHNPYVFVGTRNKKPLSNMALTQFMRGLGYGSGCDKPYVPHGFRSSFRDWSGEVSHFPRDVCEMALAHTIPNKAEAAYRRGDLLQKRREMMQQWADYIMAVQLNDVRSIKK